MLFRSDLADRGGRVRRFMRALAAGYAAARANPERAVTQLVRANPGLQRKVQLASVRATLPVFFPADRDRPFGYQDRRAWDAYGRWMHDNELVRNPPKASRAATNEFLPGQGI